MLKKLDRPCNNCGDGHGTVDTIGRVSCVNCGTILTFGTATHSQRIGQKALDYLINQSQMKGRPRK